MEVRSAVGILTSNWKRENVPENTWGGMAFNIPCELYRVFQVYEPDSLVRLHNGITVILEIKGQAREEQDNGVGTVCLLLHVLIT